MNAPLFDGEMLSDRRASSRPRRGGWSWGPVEGARGRYLSLGGGIQSSTLALMAAHGEIDGPLPDAALYSPVGDAQATVDHIAWLGSGNVLPFPVKTLEQPKVTLRQAIQNRVEQSGRYVSIPAFMDNGRKLGQDRRQCTREYKSDRLSAAQRALIGAKPRQRLPTGSIEVWIGYSTDEVIHAGAAFDTWAVNRFPLLEKRMSVTDCEAWLRRHDYPVPPRSKCTFCPYRTDAEWRWLRENEPEAWTDAVEIDRLIRQTPGMRSRSYLHSSRKPLADVDLSTAEERGQSNLLSVCEAGCGV